MMISACDVALDVPFDPLSISDSYFAEFPTILTAGNVAISVNADMEAEALTDISHLITDFASLLNPPKSVLRILSIVGRICVP